MSSNYDENSGDEFDNDRTRLRPSRKERSRRSLESVQSTDEEKTRVQQRKQRRAPKNIKSRAERPERTRSAGGENSDSDLTQVVRREKSTSQSSTRKKSSDEAFTKVRVNQNQNSAKHNSTEQTAHVPRVEELSDALADADDKIMLVVNTVTPLIAAIAKLRFLSSAPNFAQLRLDTEKQFNRLKQSYFGSETTNEGFVEHISFGLCFFIDDVVMNLPWESDWHSRSLASLYHTHTRGGEEFFTRLEAISAEPSKYIQILVLYYVFLELGFVGEHRNKSGEQINLSELKQRTYNIICRYRPEDDSVLSHQWRGYEQSKSIVLRNLPYWVIFSFFITVCAAVYGYSWWTLGVPSAEVKQSINNYANQEPIEVGVREFGQLNDLTSQQVESTNVYESLAKQEPDLVEQKIDYYQAIRDALTNELQPQLDGSSPIVEVDSSAKGPVITLVGSYLFKTGQFNIPKPQEDIVRKVAEYLKEYDLSAEVHGHTDSTRVIPGQSRYRNNFELSERRAQSVYDILLASGVDRRKLIQVGHGKQQPIMVGGQEDMPNSRRVEIIIKLKKSAARRSNEQGS